MESACFISSAFPSFGFSITIVSADSNLLSIAAAYEYTSIISTPTVSSIISDCSLFIFDMTSRSDVTVSFSTSSSAAVSGGIVSSTSMLLSGVLMLLFSAIATNTIISAINTINPLHPATTLSCIGVNCNFPSLYILSLNCPAFSFMLLMLNLVPFFIAILHS